MSPWARSRSTITYSLILWPAPMSSLDRVTKATPAAAPDEVHSPVVGDLDPQHSEFVNSRFKARKALRIAQTRMRGGPRAFRLRQPLKTIEIGYRKYIGAPHNVEARLFTGQPMQCVLP